MRVKKHRFPGRMRGLHGRKAQAETQLNWIFILIVGAVIMAFFAFIVIKQRTASEAKFSGKVSQQLNTILVGAKVSSGTVQEIPTPDLSIRFTCNDYYIGPASQRLGNRIVFAPEYLEGNKLITWTLDWNVPFKITSFLYMTSPFVKYVVVGEGQKADDIYLALPPKLNKAQVSPSDYAALRDEGDWKLRFIFVDQDNQDIMAIPAAFADVEVSGLKVRTVDRSMQFLERSAADPNMFTDVDVPFSYTEKEVLYAAIFSDRHDEFDCLMKRAYARLNTVARVYYEKLNAMAPIQYATNCEGYYNQNTNLKDMIQATDDYPLDSTDLTSIANAVSGLKDTNSRLQIYSCPLIY